MVQEQEFVVFYSPGTFIDERSERLIERRDIAAAVRMAEFVVERYGAKPYAFRFETRLIADPIPDGRGGVLHVESKVVDQTGYHFLGGILLTVDEVEARKCSDEKVLLFNMRHNCPIVCETRNPYRHTGPFNDDDCIVDAHGTVVERGNDPRHVAYRRSVADASR